MKTFEMGEAVAALRRLKECSAQVSRDEVPTMLGQLREVEARLLQRLHTAPVSAPSQSEQLLDVAEAAARLKVGEDWLYRHWKQLPFARKCDFGLRFSEAELNAYIRNSNK